MIALFLLNIMLKRNILILLLFLGTCSGFTFAQNDLDVDFDYAQFSYENNVLVELYYSFIVSQLTPAKIETGYEVAGYLNIQIYDSLKSQLVLNKEYKIPSYIQDTTEFSGNKKQVGQLNLVLDPSKYSIKIIAKDYYTQGKSVEFNKTLNIEKIPLDKLSASSLQLCDMISKSENEQSIFYKNGLEVTPNPSRLFGSNISELYYYFELYNLETEFTEKNYKIVYKITNDNNVIKEFQKEYSVKSNSKVEFGSFDVSMLSSGKYELLITVSKKNENNPNLQIRNNFWVYNKGTVSNDFLQDDISLEDSEYKQMDSVDVENEIAQIGYILNEKNNQLLNNIKSLKNKKLFLIKFWQSLDPTPGTTKNEFKLEYLERIKYSNSNLKNNYQDGWKTDRGRVMCIYGKPDEIERYDFTSDTRPYEIWRYNTIQGGILFAFIDLSNVGSNYTLVHSTAKGELSDEDWKRRLDPRK